MSKEWDENATKLWGRSPIMKELERLQIEKKAQQAQKLKQISDEAKKTQESISGAKKELDTFLQNSTDDQKTEDEHEDAKQNLLRELEEMAVQAADQGNIKLAYRIERTISEILSDEE